MQTKTKQIDNPKDFDTETKIIDSINSLNDESIEIYEYSDITASITKNGIEMEIEVNVRNAITDEGEINNPVKIKFKDKNYLIENLNFRESSTSIKKNIGIGFVSKYLIHTMRSDGFKKQSKCAFKAFFPVKESDIIDFYNQFETVTYQRDGTEYFYDCVSFYIDSLRFDITQFKKKDKGYYVIECYDNVFLETFRNYCFAIQKALGFICGRMLGNEVYIFCEKKEVYYTNYIRPEIKSMYVPLHTNPYIRLHFNPDLANDYINKLTHLNPIVFSNLVSKILNSSQFSSCIILLLEASSIRSLLVIPSLFSVIIESLSSIILTPEIGKEFPINDPNLKDKIMGELLFVIDNNSQSIPEKSVLKLKNRIKDINKPLIKERLTNLEKLILPFEKLGLKLNNKDWEVIEHRNDLLHGNILLNTVGETKTIKETDAYMNYVAARLYTLISKLILKHIGYEGYIYNHSKFNEKFIGINSDEEYFELI